MTNLEKYKYKIEKELFQTQFCVAILKIRTNSIAEDCIVCCCNRSCIACRQESIDWLAQEYTEPKKEFTQDELTILKNIDNKWKWIARDKNNTLCIYAKKPCKVSGCWINSNTFEYVRLFNCFQQIQFEDDEPVFIDDYVDRKGD